jgi:hypothetical protein
VKINLELAPAQSREWAIEGNIDWVCCEGSGVLTLVALMREVTIATS